MAESVDCSDFCRLCLVKEQVNTPIFEELGDLQQIYIKITACLPIKVSLEDPLPKRICDECSYKLDQQYNFWNTSINAEKQLRQWLGLPEEPPTKSENVVSGKIKREKDNYESPSKRPRRNARRKAAQHVRQAAAAAIAASDSGPGEDMDLDAFTKEENDSDNDFHDNNESMEDSTYANVGLDSEEHGEAGPSGLQKGAVTSTNSGTDAGGPGKITTDKDEEIIKPTGLNQTEDHTQGNDYCTEETEITSNKDGYILLDDNTFKCLRCKHAFKTIDEWQQHYKIHKIRKRYLCDVCRETFRYSWELRQHKINAHNLNSKYYTCDVCGKGYTSKKTLNRHKKRHATNGFKCSHCTEGYATLTQLQNHIDEVHSAFSAYCNICDKYFANKFNYKSHFQAFHDDEYIAQIHTCEICGKMYNTKAYLKKHVRSHVGYHCDICGKFLTTKQSLDHHVQLHLGTTKVKCDECGKHFSTKKTLHTHKRQHTGEKPYQCWICGKRFVQRSSLVIHSRYHTGERPYKCTICNKAFVNKALLNSHAKNKHDKTT